MASITEMLCVRHGNYPVDSNDVMTQCPKCQKIKAEDLCVECEKHSASINFAEGTIAYIHGMSARICRCCYAEKLRATIDRIIPQYNALVKDIEANPCKSENS